MLCIYVYCHGKLMLIIRQKGNKIDVCIYLVYVFYIEKKKQNRKKAKIFIYWLKDYYRQIYILICALCLADFFFMLLFLATFFYYFFFYFFATVKLKIRKDNE